MTRSAARAAVRAASSIAGMSWRTGPRFRPVAGSAVGRAPSGIRPGHEERQPLPLRPVDEDPERVVARAVERQVPEVDRERQHGVPAVGMAAGGQVARRAGHLAAVRIQQYESDLVLVVGLGRGDEQAEDERQVGVAERERPAAETGDPAAQDVELLAGLRLGRVGEEGELDVGHRRDRTARPCAGARPIPGWSRYRVDAAAARFRLGAIRTAGPWPLVPLPPRPASSAKVTCDRGTSGSPRRTRAKYSPVAEPFLAATCSGVPSAMIRPPRAPPSGPRSTIQSAVLITSRLCSITSTVLPPSTRRWSTSSSFSTSAKWRPVVGSSRT